MAEPVEAMQSALQLLPQDMWIGIYAKLNFVTLGRFVGT
jgi:hypothetical protein